MNTRAEPRYEKCLTKKKARTGYSKEAATKATKADQATLIRQNTTHHMPSGELLHKSVGFTENRRLNQGKVAPLRRTLAELNIGNPRRESYNLENIGMDVWHSARRLRQELQRLSMPIDNWLSVLAQSDHSATDGDLEALADLAYPFLTHQSVCNQVEQLSGHLGARHQVVRRMVIAYSLYIRQVDTILEYGARAFCGSSCPNPPAGCCNRNHYVTMNVSDLMSSHNSPASLHMAHVIGMMQQLESAHNLDGRSIRPGYCTLLAHDGCTLRLFKSPRCAHFMCENAEAALQANTKNRGTAFLAAMKQAEGSTISSPADYWSPEVLAEAVILFGPAPLATASRTKDKPSSPCGEPGLAH